MVLRGALRVFTILLSWMLLQQAVFAQSCPAPETFCHSDSYCAGMNTGFFSYWTLDRPFIDQARGSGVAVTGYDPDSIARNENIPLDADKYPTDSGREIRFLFNASGATTHEVVLIPSGQYVILWDGNAVNPWVHGGGSSGVIYEPATDPQRIEFTFDPNPIANTWFSYENAPGGHVTNIRIVPIAYEAAYSNWSWSNFQINSPTNPPIFFPSWIDKMKSACLVRYMQARNTNDQDNIFFERDSSLTRISPSNAVWLQGFNLGVGPYGPASQAHVWPWELIVESTLQTQTVPWINFRAFSYEKLVGADGILNTADDDSLIADIAALFRDNYGGKIYVEYGNEIWNYAWPFNVSTQHVVDNGPGTNTNLEENYTLRSNAVQQAFADEYGMGGGNSCDALGVLASQARAPWRIQNAVGFADTDYIDVLSAAPYFGGDANPNSTNSGYLNRWNFLSDLYDDIQAGTKTDTQAYGEINAELLTGSTGLVVNNWQNDLVGHVTDYVNTANANNMCLAFYEGGLHWRLDGLDSSNSQHVGVADMFRDYQNSQELANVEIEVNNWFLSNNVGPNVPYTNFMSAGWGSFSYWDSVFQESCSQSPRAAMIGAYSTGTPLVPGVHPNLAPIVDVVTNQQTSVGASVNLQLSGSDPENDPFVYTATGLPPSLSVDSNTGLITGTAGPIGVYDVSVSATDVHGLQSCVTSDFSWAVNTIPTVTSPSSGSMLSVDSETFSWTANGASVVDWWLNAGASVGTGHYFNSGSLGATTTTLVTGLPNDGSTVYVRLWYRMTSTGPWEFIDETYIAATVVPPEVVSPAPGIQLTGATETFSWLENEVTVTDWWLYAGDVQGGSQYFNSGVLGAAELNAVISGLPIDGSDVHLSLWYQAGGSWSVRRYVYTAVAGSGPAISSPTPGSTFTAATETIAFEENSLDVEDWWLYAGSSLGGNDYFNSGSLDATETSVDATGLATDGSTIHVTLWYRVAGMSWVSIPYTYTAATILGPEVSAPIPGSSLTGPSANFSWTDNGAGVIEWWIYAGSTGLGSDYYDSGNLGLATAATVTGLPGGGADVFVTLWYRLSAGGPWQRVEYTYTSD